MSEKSVFKQNINSSVQSYKTKIPSTPITNETVYKKSLN